MAIYWLLIARLKQIFKCLMNSLIATIHVRPNNMLILTKCVLQTASLLCAKDSEPGNALKDCIPCALKILEREQESQKKHGWLSEDLQSEGQCPIRGEIESFNIGQLQLVDKIHSLTSKSSFAFVSPCLQIHKEVRLLLPNIFFSDWWVTTRLSFFLSVERELEKWIRVLESAWEIWEDLFP